MPSRVALTTSPHPSSHESGRDCTLVLQRCNKVRPKMHSSANRVQQVFGFFTSVAFAVAAIIAVSVLLSPQAPSAKLQLQDVQVYVYSVRTSTAGSHTDRPTRVRGRPHAYSSKREEYAHVKFDLDAGNAPHPAALT